jgi:hypothetical protein
MFPSARCVPNSSSGSASALLFGACFTTSHREAVCSSFRGIQTAGNTQFGGVQLERGRGGGGRVGAEGWEAGEESLSCHNRNAA